jgi:internalin A
MKKAVILLFSAVLFLVSCQKEIKYSLTAPSATNSIIDAENQKLRQVITTQTQRSYVNGWIVNEQNEPVQGATILCGGKTVSTDNKGYFNFKEALTLNKDYALITVKKSGYMNGFKTFTPSSKSPANHAERIMLQTTGNTQWVPVSGTSIFLDNQIKLTFPANAVIKQSGIPYSGSYKVVARYIDPQSPNFPDIIPGMLTGLNSNDRLQSLQSLGMANVDLQDSIGNKLEIAPGIKVKMELPADANSPSIVPLWHFNEKFGVWIQAGVANKTGSVYTAEVNHFSIWNIDLEFNNFRLDLKFVDAAQIPHSALRVWVYRQTNNAFVGSYFTDNNGEATLINCPSNEGLILKTIFPCDTIYKMLAPVTQSRIETVVFNSTGANIKVFNFSGLLYDCNNAILPNQAFQILINNGSSGRTALGITDAQGRFTTGTLICGTGNTALAQTAAFYNTAYRYSTVSTVTTGNNIYNPVVCDSLVPGPNYQDNQVITFSDINLEQKVRQAINKPTGTLFYIDVKFLTELTADNLVISSLEGIQYCTGLTFLRLWDNAISDLSPLQNLTGLTELRLNGNQIVNITPLQNLTSLSFLGIGRNRISNIIPLQNLINLTTLTIETNQISNITPLQNLTNLTDLKAWQNQISNITPLQNLTNLEFIELWRNQIVNISPLQNLINLKVLAINKNQISNIAPLQNLINLTNLNIDSNKISNIKPLQNLIKLNSLYLQNNLVSDISPLQNLVNLWQLILSQNQIVNISALRNMTGLNHLFLIDNFITDITPLQNLISLRSIYLRNNRIGNSLTLLQNLSNLETLGLSINLISTIQPIMNSFPSLTRFGILTGNTVPSAEITTFQANHPSCIIN